MQGRGILAATAALLVLAQAAPCRADFKLKVDASQPAAALKVVVRHAADPAEVDAVMALPATGQAVAHSARFDPRATAQAWRQGLIDAAQGRAPDPDPFRFQRMVERRAQVEAMMAAIAADPERLRRDITALDAPYTPPQVKLSATMVLVVGSNSSGWTTDDASTFYLDVVQAGGDLEGAKAVAAHELYHLVLAQVLPQPRSPQGSGWRRVEEALRNGIDEGMANHVGRFTKGDTGVLSELNQRIEARNATRRRYNFKLLDALLLSAFQSDAVSADDIGVIAFSGSYDEAGYDVFAFMAEAIEKEKGRDYLLSLLPEPATRFVLAYHALQSPEARRFRFAPETLKVIGELDMRLDGKS